MDNLSGVISNTIIEHKDFEKAMTTIEQAISAIGSINNSIPLALVGPSRMGKTTLVTHINKIYPPKRNEEGLIQPIVYCRVPSQPSLRGLAMSLMNGLNDPFDPIIKISGESGERALKARSVKLIKECGVKAVIFDESQHLTRDPNSKSTYAATEWIKTLIDETNVVLIMAGLNTTTNLFDQNEQLLGRCLSTLKLNRFDWLDSKSQVEFFGVLAAFHERMANFDIPEFYESDLAFRMYVACGGLMGLLSKLLTQLVWDAITEKRLKITIQDFAVAYEKTMRVSDSNVSANPFSKGTKLIATAETIAMAKSIGTHIPAPRTRRH